MQRTILSLFVLITLLALYAECRFKPFDTSDPNPTYRKHITHKKPISPLWGDVNKQFPTNVWWLNLVMNAGDQTVNTFPYISKAKKEGLCFTRPLFTETKDYILSNYVDEWCTRFSNSEGHKVVKYDELTVTIKYTLGGNSVVNVPFAQGMAFVTAEYENAKFEASTINAILEVKDENGKSYKPEEHPSIPGSKFIFRLNNDHMWVLYFDTKITLVVDSSAIRVDASYTGSVKFGFLEKEDMAKTLDKYRHAHIVNATVDYNVSATTARIFYKFGVKGTGELLMLAFPHHLDVLQKPVKVPAITYRTIRGNVVGIQGSEWQFYEILPRYTWDSPTQIDPAKLPEIKKALEQDYKAMPDAKDPYFFGVQIGRLAKMALIADQINDTEKAAYLRKSMETAIIPWLTGTNPNALLYDTSYGGIVSTEGANHESNDFGNGWYNDHHFHYGYHVFACAVIARKNHEFVTKYKSIILTYAREFSNPSPLDPYFTVTRNKDWWGWHSWAAGLFEFADGRNQESTSEGLMAYYGIMLLGDALKNTEMASFGRLLLAMEIRAAKTYWHMPSKSKIYPDIFKQNKMVGILWANKVDYATFFGKNDLFIHGIQMLPFLPPTESCLDKEFITEEYEIIKNQNSPADWTPYRVSARAIIQKEEAWNEALPLTIFHTGSCKTILLHWIATRP